MSLMMMLAACGQRDPITVTFTSNTTWVAPDFLNELKSASGFGARGTDGTPTYVQQYDIKYQRVYFTKTGEYITENNGSSTDVPGPMPQDRSTTYNYPSDHPLYYWHEDLVLHTNTSYTIPGTPTTGASATGFSKTFPGSTGNVAPTVTTFENIAVNPGQSYQIVVPAGGSITITY